MLLHCHFEKGQDRYIPTGFSSMIFWALVFAADMFAGVTVVEVKNRRKNEMVGKWYVLYLGRMCSVVELGRRGGQ